MSTKGQAYNYGTSHLTSSDVFPSCGALASAQPEKISLPVQPPGTMMSV